MSTIKQLIDRVNEAQAEMDSAATAPGILGVMNRVMEELSHKPNKHLDCQAVEGCKVSIETTEQR